MLKLLIVGALAVVAILAITQAIIVIAPYLAITGVIGFLVYLGIRSSKNDE